MKKFTLTYGQEYEEDFLLAVKSRDLQIAVSEYLEHLRSLYKYEDKEKIEIQVVRDMLWEYLRERNLEEFFP